MNSDDIEWDPAKAASNARRHGGVTFHDAAAEPALAKREIMNANFDEDDDEEYRLFKNATFSNAKRVKDVPHLRALQEKYAKAKVPVALELNQDALGIFRGHAFMAKVSLENYLTNILEQHAYRLQEEMEARLTRGEASANVSAP